MRLVGEERRQSGGAESKRRRREVVECLATYGLARGPRRLLRDASGQEPETARARRLRLALEELGGAFAAFGLYASGRADIFGAADCAELSALRDAALPLPLASAAALFEREVGRPTEAVFAYFEQSPFESRVLSQSHRAVLHDGTNVVVKLARPAEQFADDLVLLALLKDALAADEWARADASEVLADFRQTLRQRLDLLNEVAAFEALALDAEGFEALKVPSVFRDLCSPRVLTFEGLTGSRLGEQPAYIARDPERHANASEESARLLCLVWLRQALLGRAFPAEARDSNVLVVERGRLAFTGGAFATLRPESQANVLDYLVAVSAEEPDRACTCLLKELKGDGDAARERLLRQGFRQVVPFRDGGWTGGTGLTLAEHLFLHWRIASEHGYAPRAHFVPFYRGLFSVAALAQRVSPDTDALLEALRDVRLMSGLSQLREMVGLEGMGDRAERYASLMTELPQWMDDALTRASGGDARMRVRVGETESERRRKNSAASVMSLLAVVVSLTLLLRAVAGGAVWLQRAAVVVFTLCGVMLLRAAGRIK